MDLGFPIGTGIGSAVLTRADVINLGWVSALFVTVSLGLLVLTGGREEQWTVGTPISTANFAYHRSIDAGRPFGS